MSKQTINIGASPNDGTGTPLRTSFDYTNQNFTEIYTALGGGVALPGATTQVIFNDGGTNLAGDAGLVYNKTTDALTVAGLVTAGSATISGDLTVDTNVLKVDSTLNKVGIGVATLTGLSTLNVAGDIALTSDLVVKNSGGTVQGYIFGSSGLNYRVVASNPHVWQEGGTDLMRLNSTGLGIGAAPVTDCKLTVRGGSIFDRGVGGGSPQLLLSLAASSGGNYGQISNTGTRWALGFGGTLTTVGTEALVWDSSANVGIGVTPSAWTGGVKALDMGSGGLGLFSNGGITVNAFFDSTDSRWEYKTNGPATYYNLQTGVHQWFVAASGTANNPITTFATPAMELTATGNLAFPTGKGIDFAATTDGSGTMTSELLADYEEGVFDASFATGGGTVTINPASNQCRYTKIGRLVTVQGDVQVSSVSSPTGALLISGLPYTIATGAEGNAYSAMSVFPSGLEATATGQIVGYGVVGSVSIYMYRYEAGTIIGLAPSAKAASEFAFSMTYSV